MIGTSFKTALPILFAAGAIVASPEFTLSYRYQAANTQQNEHGQQLVSLNENRSETNDPRIDKAIFVAKLGDLITQTIANFLTQCEDATIPWEEPLALSTSTTIVFPPMPPVPNTRCDDAKITLANELLQNVSDYAHQAANISATAHDEQIAEALDLLRKLAVNMRNFTGFYSSIELAPSFGTGIGHVSAGPKIGVTTGGAQDYGFFKKVVDNGYVPRPESFDAKGFMSEFDLPMGDSQCEQLLCLSPVYKYESETKKLFVSVSMNTNVAESTFVRKPLNLALVIDISGSMQAPDDTEKSRLEWAKEAALKTISELNHNDFVSVVVFDSTAEILVPATQLSSPSVREHLEKVISGLQTKGSTNLYDGLKAGYELVSDNAQHLPDYNHRVILISDAGLNTGVTDEAVNVGLVSNYAAENIGITAIGLGLNFNQDFVNGIANSLGGNYIYAHSGKDMVRYFSSFKFLVSPIAHYLKARISFANTAAKLVKAYGIPGEALSASDELIAIQSLFLTNQGGGAILLEYLLD